MIIRKYEEMQVQFMMSLQLTTMSRITKENFKLKSDYVLHESQTGEAYLPLKYLKLSQMTTNLFSFDDRPKVFPNSKGDTNNYRTSFVEGLENPTQATQSVLSRT